MKLTFTLTPDELVLLSMEANNQSATYKRMVRRKIILLTFVYAALSISFYLSTLDLVLPVTLIVMAAFLLPFYATLQRRAYRRYFKKLFTAPENAIYLEKQTLTINKKGIGGETSRVATFYKWASVVKFFEDPNYFFIFVEGNRGWLVPKKIFKKGELTEFKKWFKNVSSK